MRSRPGVIRPFIVVQLLVVMMLAGAGASFALDSNAVGPTPTPGATATPIAGDSLTIIPPYALVPNPGVTQYIGVTVTVKNKDAVPHSGTVYVAIDHQGDTIAGQGYITNLAGGATIQITVDLGPIPMVDEADYLKAMRVMVTQTS